MRVVLDTNILISSCWKPDGLEARVVGFALAGQLTPCVTAAVWAEYRDVLLRDKFASLRDKASALLAALETKVVTFEAGARLDISADEDDNRFLECAAAAQAAYLITGNLRHYPTEWCGTRVVNARGLLVTELSWI